MKTETTKVNTAKYVDGYVLIVPEKNVDAYTKMARDASKVWIKCGAIEYVECRGDDLHPAGMYGTVMRNFVDLSGAKKDDTVWFSYITYSSRKHRDEVNKKVKIEIAR